MIQCQVNFKAEHNKLITINCSTFQLVQFENRLIQLYLAIDCKKCLNVLCSL